MPKSCDVEMDRGAEYKLLSMTTTSFNFFGFYSSPRWNEDMISAQFISVIFSEVDRTDMQRHLTHRKASYK